MTRGKWKIPEQRGALLVLTALLLPVFFACAGVAVDLGSMYAHKSNLQNAVDAAALAGAAGYIAGEETAEYHPGANTMSDEYLKADLGKGYQNVIDKDFQAQTVSGKTYYRVKVTQKSPVYFMTLLGLDSLMDVSADAVALVGSETSGTPDFEFKDLISVKTIGDLASLASGGSTGGNNGKAYGNNGKNKGKGNGNKGNSDTDASDYDEVITTYDGNVVYQNTAYAEKIYTSAAYYQYKYQADNAENYFYAQAGNASEYQSFYSKTTDKIDELYDSTDSPVRRWTDKKETVYGSTDFYEKEKGGNVEIDIEEITGDTAKPVYLKIDNFNENKISIDVNQTNDRPVIIIYTGESKDKKPLVLSISGNQYGPVSFTGVLYAPYADVEIDMGYDCEFIGSIYAQTLDVNSPGSHFMYKDIFSGLLNSEDSKTISKIPLLGDLPIIGQFFRHTSKTRDNRELLILITPTLVSEDTEQPMSQQMKQGYEVSQRYARNRENVNLNQPVEQGTDQQERDLWGEKEAPVSTVVVEEKKPEEPVEHLLQVKGKNGETTLVPLSEEDYQKHKDDLQIVKVERDNGTKKQEPVQIQRKQVPEKQVSSPVKKADVAPKESSSEPDIRDRVRAIMNAYSSDRT